MTYGLGTRKVRGPALHPSRYQSRLFALFLLHVLVGAVLTVALIFHVRGWLFATLEGRSMVPTYRPGDLIIAGPVTPRDLQLGEVIVVRFGDRLVAHRLVDLHLAVSSSGWALLEGSLVTRGDALPASDPPAPISALRGRVVTVVNGLGWMANYKHAIGGLLFVLYVGTAAGAFITIRRARVAFVRLKYNRSAVRDPSQKYEAQDKESSGH